MEFLYFIFAIIMAAAFTNVAADEGALRGLGGYLPLKDFGSSPHTPLHECQGDCDSDHDCAGHLVCFQRSKGHSVPGCQGSLGSNSDFCVQPATTDPTHPTHPTTHPALGATQLKMVGNPPHRKLNPCEGDCDSDHDCVDPHTMICQQREKNHPVYGCSGGRSLGDRTDYCVLKANVPGATTKATDAPPHPTTTKATDAPPHPTTTKATDAPPHPTTTKATDAPPHPTTAAPGLGELKLVANPAGYASLHLCQGDCDSDHDCAGHLLCCFRDSGDHVPGCKGSLGGRTDYCVTPGDRAKHPCRTHD